VMMSAHWPARLKFQQYLRPVLL
jgi:hypothetical protein